MAHNSYLREMPKVDLNSEIITQFYKENFYILFFTATFIKQKNINYSIISFLGLYLKLKGNDVPSCGSDIRD